MPIDADARMELRRRNIVRTTDTVAADGRRSTMQSLSPVYPEKNPSSEVRDVTLMNVPRYFVITVVKRRRLSASGTQAQCVREKKEVFQHSSHSLAIITSGGQQYLRITPVLHHHHHHHPLIND